MSTRSFNLFLAAGTLGVLVLGAALVIRAHQQNDVPGPDSDATPAPAVVAVRPVPDPREYARRSLASPPQVQPMRLSAEALAIKTWYAYGEPLPVGYKCSGAKGPVYRLSTRDGATVVEPLLVRGVMVRCAGDERSSYR